jgi:membrane-associated phospholipid phosphatase
MIRRHRSELAMFVGAYVLYNAGRWVTAGEIGPATDNAHWIWRTEQTLGLGFEHSVQNGLQGSISMWLLSHIYLAAQLVVLPGALIYLYRRAPEIYRRLRGTVLATWMLSIPIYAAFPVAPPRLAGLGFADSVSAHGAVSMTGRSSMFYNELAAVPSLHCGFAVAIGIALAAAAKQRWSKVLCLLWGPLICVTVMATGNHYVFDVAAGLAVSAAGYGIGRAHERRAVARPLPAMGVA